MTTTITVIPGDGIGPSITTSTLAILDAVGAGLTYEFAEAGITSLEKNGELVPQATLDSIAKNRVALKGPITTPVGGGFRSINVTLRQAFNLYANVRPVETFPGTLSRFENVDLITVRENTEGMYSGEGQIVTEDHLHAEAKSIITKEGSEKVIRFAFELARSKGRKKVTLIHKANILKSTSGLFLETGREVKDDYADIEYNEMIVDATAMRLVMDPSKFDVMVTTNLFGDIISDLCAGLVGGLGMAPGANIGKDAAIFEAVHGSAPDIAGKNIANPTALILASALMLDHLNLKEKGDAIRSAVREVLTEGEQTTSDLGGTASTNEFTEAVIKKLQ